MWLMWRAMPQCATRLRAAGEGRPMQYKEDSIRRGACGPYTVFIVAVLIVDTLANRAHDALDVSKTTKDLRAECCKSLSGHEF
jgi:hypothetical protein